MGKHEVGTPKYIANKMKSKGLQKLRWYCQMCQKQCRDENGFKCHTSSESHQRNLLMFADNSGKFMGEFSSEFRDGFLDILRRQYGTKRIAANKVYQDYIADKHHIHMNATRWVSLTGFVKHLGRSGACVVDETEKGWFITYIDRDPETLAKKERRSKKLRMDKDDEEKLMEFVEKQVQQGQQKKVVVEEEQQQAPLELTRDPEEKICLKLSLNATKPVVAPVAFLSDPGPSSSEFKLPKIKKENSKRKLSGIEEAIEEDKKAKLMKEKKVSKPLYVEGVVVKIITPSLGEKYHSQKAVVLKVDQTHKVIVRTLSANHKIGLDEAHLETVIPQPGKPVKILKGEYRNQTAFLKKIKAEEFRAVLEIKPLNSEGSGVIKEYPYESFSKLYVA